MALRVQNPSGFVLAGASGSGKTRWILKFIDNVDEIMEPKVTEILYFYEQWQPIFEKYIGRVKFSLGLLSSDLLNGNKDSKLVILDDLMFENPKTISKVFTIYSHPRNYTVIETVQNLFHQSYRDFTLNAQFVVLLKNCRNLNQIKYGILRGRLFQIDTKCHERL